MFLEGLCCDFIVLIVILIIIFAIKIKIRITIMTDINAVSLPARHGFQTPGVFQE